MAYKKYITRNGRRYGPYLYENKRVNGKVVTSYVGSGRAENDDNREGQKISWNKFAYLGIFVLLALIFAAVYMNVSYVGSLAMDVNDAYQEGDVLAGNLRISLMENELIPKDSKLLVDMAETRMEYALNDLVDEESISGDYYAEGTNLAGSGEGYDGGEDKILEINISKMGITAADGVLNIMLSYGDEIIASAEKEISVQREIGRAVSGGAPVGAFGAGFNLLSGCTSVECASKTGPVACTCAQINASDNVYASGIQLDCKAASCYVNSTHVITIPAGAVIQSVEAITEYGILAGGNMSIKVYKNSTNTWYLVNNTNYASGVTEAQFRYNLTRWINTSTDASDLKFLFYIAATGVNPKLDYDLTWINISYLADSAPTSRLVSPANGNITSANSVNFTCNATDDAQLRNITFYWNYSGGFVANETISVSGLFNSTSFIRGNLNNGTILWNCLACDNASQCSFASANFSVNVNPSADLAPSVNFLSQNPADISTSNVFASTLRINYSITDSDVTGVNASRVLIYYKTNSTASNIFEYVNGTSSQGFYSATGANISSNWSFAIYDGQVYPATYNFDERTLELEPHLTYNLDKKDDYLKERFFNVSNSKQYAMFELMASNKSASSTALRIYYCNSSYATGNPATSANCLDFYNLDRTALYNHTHSAYSSHYVVPFAINTITGKVGSVFVTPISYFLISPSSDGSKGWYAHYITNVSRTDSVQLTENKGSAWTNLTGILDMHIHQYDGTEIFYYYACANDTANNQGCSSTRYDSINLTGLPPIAPFVYSPIAGNYSGIIAINYTAASSPNGYAISYYNISLADENETFVKTIQSNNLLSLSYAWNSAGTSDGSYIIRVQACDVLNQCSYGFSDGFAIDNTAPFISIASPANTTYNNLTVFVNISTIGANYVWFRNSSGQNETYITSGLRVFNEGSNTLYAYANDSAGNLNSTSVTFTIDTCAPNITNTSWSEWSNLTCIGNQKNQSRFIVQYDSNNCNETANQTFYEYRLVGPAYANTTWGDWKNISCLPGDVMNQTRNLTQFDVYACAANTTFFEYRATEACNYCSESIIGPFNTTCLPSNTLTRYYIDSNYATCCAVTGIISDCSIINNPSYANQTLTCQYDTTAPSFNAGNTRPAAGSQYNQTQTVNIAVNPSESSTVFANISWDATSQIVNLGYNGTNWYYNGSFLNTNEPGVYTVVINATDTSGNSNATTTNFVINDITAPSIGSVSPASGAQFNPSYNINITANVTDSFFDSVSSVIAQITYPNGTSVNYTLTEIDNTQIFDYLTFNDTAQLGRYNLTIIASDSSGNVNVSRSWFNLTSSDVTAPAITSYLIEPLDPYIGGNVSISASATDNVAISGIFANITLPNGTVLTIPLDSNYTVQAAGRHNVTIWANDTSGIIASISGGYFIAGSASVNIQFNVVDSSINGIPANLTIYLTGTNDKVHEHDFTGSYNDAHTNILYDLYYQSLDDNIFLRLNNVNLSRDYNNTLGLDRTIGLSGFLVTYGINNTYLLAGAVLNISYNGTGYSNEDNLGVYRCANWDFVSRTCLGTWENVTANATQDKLNDRFGLIISGFSAYSIKQEGAATPVIPSGGGGGASYVKKEISVETDLLGFEILQGESKSESLKTKNSGNADLNVVLSVEGLEGMLSLGYQDFALKKGEEKIVDFKIAVPAGKMPGIYTGKIIIAADGIRKVVNVIVNVKEQKALFDIAMSVNEGSKKISSGENVTALIDLMNLGLQRDITAGLLVYIADLDKNELFRVSEEQVTIDKTETVREMQFSFAVPASIKPGTYMIVAHLSYENSIAEAYATFEVAEKAGCGIVCWLVLAVVLSELLLLLWILLFRRREERRAEFEAEKKIGIGTIAVRNSVVAFGKTVSGEIRGVIDSLERILKRIERKTGKAAAESAEVVRETIRNLRNTTMKVESRAFAELGELSKEVEAELLFLAERFRKIRAGVIGKGKSAAADAREVAGKIEKETLKKIKESSSQIKEGFAGLKEMALGGAEETILSLEESLRKIKRRAGKAKERAVEMRKKLERDAKKNVLGAEEMARALRKQASEETDEAIIFLEEELGAIKKRIKAAKNAAARIEKDFESVIRASMNAVARKAAVLKEEALEEIEEAVKEKPVKARMSEQLKEGELFVLSAKRHKLFEELKNLAESYDEGVISKEGYIRAKDKIIEEIKALKNIVDKGKRVKRFTGKTD